MKYEMRNDKGATTSSGVSNRSYVINVTFVPVSWWKRIWRKVKR